MTKLDGQAAWTEVMLKSSSPEYDMLTAAAFGGPHSVLLALALKLPDQFQVDVSEQFCEADQSVFVVMTLWTCAVNG